MCKRKFTRVVLRGALTHHCILSGRSFLGWVDSMRVKNNKSWNRRTRPVHISMDSETCASLYFNQFGFITSNKVVFGLPADWLSEQAPEKR